MSRQSGKARDPAARKPTRTSKRGETQIDKQAFDLQKKADHLLADSETHMAILTSQDTNSLRNSVQQLQNQASRMTAIHKAHSKELEMIREKSDHSSSDIEEGEESHSGLGSLDTERYTLLSSPLSTSHMDKSPRQVEQPPPQVFQPSPIVNPQFNLNLPPTMPNTTAGPTDPLTIMQNMFAQQAIANRQQQEAMMAQQTLFSQQQSETNKQLQLLLATQLDRQMDQQQQQLKQQESIVERQAIADARLAVKQMRDGNIVQYLEHFEMELGDALIPPAKWKTILVGKLSPKAERVCAHLINDLAATYDDMKHYLLHNIGPSMDELCNIVHGAYHPEFQDKREAQKLQHCRYLAERYFLGAANKEEHLAIRLYKFHANKKFIHNIKLSKKQSFTDLLELATSFDGQLDYEKFYKNNNTYTHNRERPSHRKPFCDFCKKIGHKEETCFKRQGSNRPNIPQNKSSGNPSPQGNQVQPKYTQYKQKETGVTKRPATVNWSQTRNTVNSIQGTVNGHKADITIDTGAQITVVPGKFIYDDNLTGQTIDILGVNGNPRSYQLARIPIIINNTEVEEEVAVAPENQLNSRVLLAAPLCQTTTQHLIDSYLTKHSTLKQVRAVTRAKTLATKPVSYKQQLDTTFHEDDRASDLSYTTESDYTDTDDTSNDDTSGQPHAPLDKHLPPSPLASSPLLPQNQTHFNPEPYSSNLTQEPYSSTIITEPQSSHLIPEPYSLSPTPEPYSSSPTPEPDSSTLTPESYDSPPKLEPYSSPSNPELHNLSLQSEPYSSNLKSNKSLTEPYSPDKEPQTEQGNNSLQTDMVDEELPEFPILSQTTNKQVLKQQTKDDPTLKTIRGLAHHQKNGYGWENGLIKHRTTDSTIGEKDRLVVPKPLRQLLVKTAHDKSGHFSVNKTKAILNNRFTWPGMGKDVNHYILSCETCKKHNKHTHKPAPLHPRPVITEPFDEVALDIIGPLPRSRHGYRFALTAICMASRWPEVYPLKNTKAESIVNSLIEFLARNGIPSKILTDQGSQFTSEVMAQTCQLLGVTHITTVPYRPQGNGILERFHGTLKPLLAKATSKRFDWVQFLPLALSAIRAIPCRSTGFSPSEIVFGKNSRNMLDIVYEGLTNTTYAEVDIPTWVAQLNDKLEILRDSATLTNTVVRNKQNSHSKHSRSIRTYKPGDLVFTRIPGCRANLQASWEGLFTIVKSIPPLNYEIRDADNTWSRTTHINNLKTFKPMPTCEPLQVQAACLVAEENIEMSKMLDNGPSLVGGPCIGYSQGEMDQLLQEYADVFSSTPGEAQVEPFSIRLEQDALPSSRPPYQVPIHLREEVNGEINKLLKSNIIEPSTSVDWCAPIVPVRKPDKTIRLCVDYRELNKVTPLDRHIIPTLPDILDRVGQAAVLSKIDLTSGFHQIQVDAHSRDLTTFLSPRGKFRFVRMPFGLKNAPSHFQRCMEKVLQPVSRFAAVYIDDIIVFSDSWTQHLQHLQAVFQCFREASLTAKPSKCSFGKKELQYLGHNVGSGKVVVPQHRITALEQYKRPITKKTLRSFLGCMSYYRKFIPKYANMSALLTPSTSVSAPKVVAWTEEMDRAFELLKVSLVNNVTLTIPSLADTFTLHTDASGHGIGACLHVIRDEEELPVAFYSRQLQNAEKRYSITELETLAIVAAIKHFQFYIYGAHINIITDHKACTALLTSTVLNTRLKRMALFLQDKDICIMYRPGQESGNADGFSRQFDDQDTSPAMNSFTPVSLPKVEAAGGCGSSGAPAGSPPSTPPILSTLPKEQYLPKEQ